MKHKAGDRVVAFFKWTKRKPKFNQKCLVICATQTHNGWDYTLFIVDKMQTVEGWYWGWLTSDWEEYGDLEDMKADKYYLMPLLRTCGSDKRQFEMTVYLCRRQRVG